MTRLTILLVVFSLSMALHQSSFASLGRTTGPSRVNSQADPGGVTGQTPIPSVKPDFKKLDLTELKAARKPSPDLTPVVNELFRHAELKQYSIQISPWIYTRAEEAWVADFEAAVNDLEFVESQLFDCLEQASFDKNLKIGELNSSIRRSRRTMDDVEFTLFVIRELIRNEL